jgi:MFS family permease
MTVGDGQDVDPYHGRGPPPDGGLQAWLVVGGFFNCIFVSLGLGYTFGAYVPTYVEVFGVSRAVAVLPGTLSFGAFIFFGPFCGRAGDYYGVQKTHLFGACLTTAGLLLASFATSMAQVVLCQGILAGIGFSVCYYPALGAVNQFFAKNRGLANALGASGAGVGTLVLAPATDWLIKHYGWESALRIKAVGVFVILAPAQFMLRRRLPLAREGGLNLDVGMFKVVAPAPVHIRMRADSSRLFCRTAILSSCSSRVVSSRWVSETPAPRTHTNAPAPYHKVSLSLITTLHPIARTLD